MSEKLQEPLGGKVAIIGAGPGDPELLTVRAARLIAKADVILKDNLAADALLEGVDARIIDVGKIPGGKRTSQSVIHGLLIKEAKAGAFVVRLKGGDPFVFGRGGEEALALTNAGISFEIVPGISSCLSVPASANIPVTHRGITTHFSVVTGVGSNDADLEKMWREVAGTGGTMVVLMGVGNAGRIARAAMDAGRNPETPCAVIANGTRHDEQIVQTTLECLEQSIHEHEVCAPATIIIGDVVSLRNQISKVIKEEGAILRAV